MPAGSGRTAASVGGWCVAAPRGSVVGSLRHCCSHQRRRVGVPEQGCLGIRARRGASSPVRLRLDMFFPFPSSSSFQYLL